MDEKKKRNRINAETLSLVLGKPVYWIADGEPKNKIGYSSDTNSTTSISKRCGYSINSYELAYEDCKEFAWANGFSIEVEGSRTTGRARLKWNEEMGFCRLGFQKQHTYYSDWFNEDDRETAIFTACEFIVELEKRKKEEKNAS